MTQHPAIGTGLGWHSRLWDVTSQMESLACFRKQPRFMVEANREVMGWERMMEF